MLVVRLQRTGRRNQPTYRMVVAEHSMPVKGRVKEIVGHYLPTREEADQLTLDQDRITYWISQGATPSNTVARILTNNGMKGLEKFIKAYTKQKPKEKSAEGEGDAGSPPAESAEATDAPEKPSEEPKEDAAPEEEKTPNQASDASSGSAQATAGSGQEEEAPAEEEKPEQDEPKEDAPAEEAPEEPSPEEKEEPKEESAPDDGDAPSQKKEEK